MSRQKIALFGESERGEFQTAYFFRSVVQIADHLGNPPKNSLGLYYAIQALLLEKDLIFFRVEEEGFSIEDYMLGIRFLEQKKCVTSLDAICLPGVGNAKILKATEKLCKTYNSVLIMKEADLYDYLTFC